MLSQVHHAGSSSLSDRPTRYLTYMSHCFSVSKALWSLVLVFPPFLTAESILYFKAHCNHSRKLPDLLRGMPPYSTQGRGQGATFHPKWRTCQLEEGGAPIV